MTVDQSTYSEMISHRNLGLSYLEEERYSDALNEFNMLVNIADEEPLGYANLGLTYMRMSGQLLQSEEWLEKALLLAPDDPDIMFLLAKVYELTGRQPKAKTRQMGSNRDIAFPNRKVRKIKFGIGNHKSIGQAQAQKHESRQGKNHAENSKPSST